MSRRIRRRWRVRRGRRRCGGRRARGRRGVSRCIRRRWRTRRCVRWRTGVGRRRRVGWCRCVSRRVLIDPDQVNAITFSKINIQPNFKRNRRVGNTRIGCLSTV